MRRAAVALTVVLTTVAMAAPSAAVAKHVTKLEPWGPKKHYLVEADLDGRPGPRLNPRSKVDFLRMGQWVRIECQVRGQKAYGSKLWDRVGGLYVPDALLKTYTDGFLSGSPRCSTATPPPAPAPTPPPAPAPPEFPSKRLPEPKHGYGSYSQSHNMGGGFEGWAFAELTRQLNTSFSHYFPFSGCGKSIHVGERCTLEAPGPNGPVRVTHIARIGFAFKSLKGHPEGAGRTITFRWFRIHVRPDSAYLDQTYLVVSAWGPVSGLSRLGPLNSDTVADHYWTKFARNIASRFPRCPPGKRWEGNRYGCRQYLI